MSEVIRIAAVDDHPIFLAGLQRALRHVSDVVIVALGTSAEDACRIATEQAPDVILLDITLPGGGIEAARTIAIKWPAVKVILLTASDDDEHVAAALLAGASGYLLKGATAAELLDAARSVHKGQPYITPALSWRLLAQSVRRELAERAAACSRSRLSDREEQIVGYVAQGLTNSAVAAKLNVSKHTVRNLMTRIMYKMQVRNRMQVIAARRQRPLS